MCTATTMTHSSTTASNSRHSHGPLDTGSSSSPPTVVELSSTTTILNHAGDLIAVPSEFVCPITLELMNYPMVSRFGHSFERDAILEWIAAGNGYCPLTRIALTFSDIIPHRPLEARIHAWRVQQNVAIPPAAKSLLSSPSPQQDSLAGFVGVLNFQSSHCQQVLLSSLNTNRARNASSSSSSSSPATVGDAAVSTRRPFLRLRRGRHATRATRESAVRSPSPQSESTTSSSTLSPSSPTLTNDTTNEPITRSTGTSSTTTSGRRQFLRQLLEDVEQEWDDIMS